MELDSTVSPIKLQHTPAGDVDIAKVADGLQKSFSMLTWDENDEAWLRNMMGLPERDVEELRAEMEKRQAKKQEEAAKIQANIQPKPDEKKAEENQDEMKATLYRSNAKDDYKRRQMERKLEDMLTEHLAATKKRIVREAKAMQGNHFEAENNGALAAIQNVVKSFTDKLGSGRR
jgi:hypothetical protein